MVKNTFIFINTDYIILFITNMWHFLENLNTFVLICKDNIVLYIMKLNESSLENISFGYKREQYK